MTKAKPRLELRDAMLAIAETILEKEGLPALQARRIAQEAECSVGTIYNVFGNIDELVLLANARTLRHLGEQLQAAQQMATSQSLEVRILALALTYLEFASTHRKRWKAVFEHVMTDSDNVPLWYREQQGTLFSTLAESLPPTMSLEEKATASQMLFSAAHGIIMLSLDRKLTDTFDPTATEKQLRMLVRFAAIGFENKS